MWGLLLLASAISGELPGDRTDTLVVCPPPMVSAMRPWMQYRESQGRVVKLIHPPANAEALSREVRRFVQMHPRLRWVVLVGDAGAGPSRTPAHLVGATANVHFGSEPEIASDNPTADLDGDGVPDVAIGRLPADTPAELSRMIAKIRRYEQMSPGLWRRQINFVAGVGGFGFVDTIIETVTKQFLTDGIPSDYCTTMTYGSWKSAYCPSPPAFHTATVERLNEGCLFWVYIGHGHRYRLDNLNVPGGKHHILDVRDMSKLRARGGPAIAIMLACYTGAFDSERDCLAEEMLRAPGGPVACLAGSRVTMPYAMAVLGNGLLEQHFVERRATLGEMLLHAKRGLVDAEDSKTRSQAGETSGETSGGDRGPVSPLVKNRQLLDMLASSVSPKPELLAAERREHMSLFNLIGDPLLRIRHPRRIPLQVDRKLSAGETIEIRGECPLPGTLHLELVSRRDQLRIKAPSRSPYVESTLAMREFDRTYVLANDRQWTLLERSHEGGAFRLPLTVPSECRGPCYIRAFLDGGDQHASGASDTFVRAAQRAAGPVAAPQ